VQARTLIGDSPREDLVGSIASLSRRDARRAVHILTGHDTLGYYMHKLGFINTPNWIVWRGGNQHPWPVPGVCQAKAVSAGLFSWARATKAIADL